MSAMRSRAAAAACHIPRERAWVPIRAGEAPHVVRGDRHRGRLSSSRADFLPGHPHARRSTTSASQSSHTHRAAKLSRRPDAARWLGSGRRTDTHVHSACVWYGRMTRVCGRRRTPHGSTAPSLNQPDGCEAAAISRSTVLSEFLDLRRLNCRRALGRTAGSCTRRRGEPSAR